MPDRLRLVVYTNVLVSRLLSRHLVAARAMNKLRTKQFGGTALEHLPIITTTAGLISSALNSIKSARELAKEISDNELKKQIGAAYETLVDLREHALTLDEENRHLKELLAQKAAYVGPVAPHGYFYAASDVKQQYALCPFCFQASQRQIGYMDDVRAWNGGLRRDCKLCKKSIFEESMDLS